MYERLRGVMPPMTTPFSRDGDIELSAVREQIEFLISAGVHGIVAGGSGGEGHTMDRADFLKLMQTASEAIAGRVPFVAGIIVNSTAEAVARGHGCWRAWRSTPSRLRRSTICSRPTRMRRSATSR